MCIQSNSEQLPRVQKVCSEAIILPPKRNTPRDLVYVQPGTPRAGNHLWVKVENSQSQFKSFHASKSPGEDWTVFTKWCATGRGGAAWGSPWFPLLSKLGSSPHRRVLHLPPASLLGHGCGPSSLFSRCRTFLPLCYPPWSPMWTFFPTAHLLSVEVCLDTLLSISTSSSPHDRVITYSRPFKCGFAYSPAGFLELQRGWDQCRILRF